MNAIARPEEFNPTDRWELRSVTPAEPLPGLGPFPSAAAPAESMFGKTLIKRDKEPSMIGEFVGGYEIVRELGRGGMGVAWLAEHPLVGSLAVVKVLRAEVANREDYRARFVREARATAKVASAGTLQLYDFVRLEDGRTALVLEYVEGVTLDRVLDEAPMEPERALGLLRQLCKVVAGVHAKGLIHRDIKAENIVVQRLADGSERVRLIDFGLAMAPGMPDESELGMAVGTPLYMAPEQILGGELDERCDVYAIGVLAWRMLTGEFPFAGTPTEIAMQKLTGEVEEAVGLPVGIPTTLLTALSRRFTDRPLSGRELAAGLQAGMAPAAGQADAERRRC